MHKIIKQYLLLIVSMSLLLGIVGVICSTYIQNHYYWSDTNYGISDCRVQAPVVPTNIVRGNKLIPRFVGCTGVKIGWPLAIAKSDVEISIGVNNPKIPVSIGELFGFGNIFLNLTNFVIDWLLWAIAGFVIIYVMLWRSISKSNKLRKTKLI